MGEAATTDFELAPGTYKVIGARLKKILKRLHVRRDDAAAILGFSGPAMSARFSGETRVEIVELLILSLVCGFSIGEVLDGVPVQIREKDPSGNYTGRVILRAWRDSNPQPPDPKSGVQGDFAGVSGQLVGAMTA